MMITRFSCLFLLISSIDLLATNLIINSEVNDKIGSEFRNVGTAKNFPLSVETEDLTGNKCLKLSIKEYHLIKNGEKSVNAGVIIGREGNSAGFIAHPDTTYEFSVELKGTVPTATISAFQWKGDCDYYKDRERLKTTIERVKVQKEWTSYTGTFKTTKDAKRAALFIQTWDQGSDDKIMTKIDDFLLIDNIIVKQKKEE